MRFGFVFSLASGFSTVATSDVTKGCYEGGTGAFSASGEDGSQSWNRGALSESRSFGVRRLGLTVWGIVCVEQIDSGVECRPYFAKSLESHSSVVLDEKLFV